VEELVDPEVFIAMVTASAADVGSSR